MSKRLVHIIHDNQNLNILNFNESFQYLKNNKKKKNLLLAAFTQRDEVKKKFIYLILHNSLQHKHQSDKLQNITRRKKKSK